MNVRRLSKAKQMAVESKKTTDHHSKFIDLVNGDTSSQLEFFLKSFIFTLGDEWKLVVKLGKEFDHYLESINEDHDLNAAQAADFLQHQGKTRTAMQRRHELKDIDLDLNDRIAFIEYLLLHYKAMILKDYFKRKGLNPTVDLTNDGVGLTGVGDMLLEELFTVPAGMDPEIEKAIEDFMEQKKSRENKVKQLEELTSKGGVKGLTAKNELSQLANQDKTEMNRIEITLNAARRKAAKFSGQQALENKKAQEKKEAQEKLQKSRDSLAARAAIFETKK